LPAAAAGIQPAAEHRGHRTGNVGPARSPANRHRPGAQHRAGRGERLPGPAGPRVRVEDPDPGVLRVSLRRTVRRVQPLPQTANPDRGRRNRHAAPGRAARRRCRVRAPTVTAHLKAGESGTIETKLYGTRHDDPGLTFNAVVSTIIGDVEVPSSCYPN